MAVTASFYGKFWLSLANKEIDFNSDTIKTMLVTSSYTFDKDAHQYKSSITNEVSGTGYTAGGATIISPSISYDAANDRLVFDGDNVSWTTATFTGARQAIVYDSTPGSDATRPLVMCVNFGQDLSPLNGTVAITWDSIGMGYVTT